MILNLIILNILHALILFSLNVILIAENNQNLL